ncbi:hypothetical protein VMCG_05740 [Cytospora schulzeri]|uniref:Cupin type-2 domain-containing protein n=1 Tax=Cytospora schulzeri TaxID=448051 RepID=A0A423WI38_9PEZI|nr:hypothetical protein VMCG_05740 [Valsa malicola]
MPPQYSKSDAPYANVTLIKQKAPENEIIQIGPLKLEVLEDGSATDRRLSAVYIYVPPRTPGPAQHWHQPAVQYSNSSFDGLCPNVSQMHDETFLVMRGTATFTSRESKITANAGDYVVVPTCSPHTFGNESDEELVLYNTFTPAFYIDYFRLMAKMAAQREDGKLTPEIAKQAMERYATLQTGVTTEY